MPYEKPEGASESPLPPPTIGLNPVVDRGRAKKKKLSHLRPSGQLDGSEEGRNHPKRWYMPMKGAA